MELTAYTKLYKDENNLFIFTPFICHGGVNTNYCKIIILRIFKCVNFLIAYAVNGKVDTEKHICML